MILLVGMFLFLNLLFFGRFRYASLLAVRPGRLGSLSLVA